MSNISSQTLNGCRPIARLHYTIYGIIATSILPFTFWGVYKHIKFHYVQRSNNKNNNSLNRLTIALYICTILSLTITSATSFGACILSRNLWHLLWQTQSGFWIIQWFLFIFILFSRYTVNTYISLH